MALINKLSAIGDAIREKTGSTDLMTLDEMPSAIAGIQTGGGEDYLALRLNADAEPWDYYSEDITEIPAKYAFAWSTIRSVDLPNLTAIGNSSQYAEGVFYQCYQLENINLPQLSVISGSTTFYQCPKLKYVVLPKYQYSEAYMTFQYSGLQVGVFPSCTEINIRCFGNCNALKALVFPGNTVVNLTNTNAFEGTVLDPDWIQATRPIIFVPEHLLDSYKTATNWAVFADYIGTLSDYESLRQDGWPDIVYPQ